MKVQIKSFKYYATLILAGVDEKLPMFLWDKLLPHRELIFNLLWQSNTAPNASVNAHTLGQFDPHYFLLAPLGSPVLIHVSTQVHTSWEKHTQ